jgi:hypothetical protein
VGLEHSVDGLAELVVVIEGLDLLDPPKGIKGIVVEVVHFVHAGICHNNIWQLLHVTNTVGDSNDTKA